MTLILIWTTGAAVAAVAAYAFAIAYGGSRWSGKTRERVAQMQAGRVTPTTTRYHAIEIAGLPAPVQRYFQAALTDGQQIIATAEVTQKGTFNMSATADQWKPFTATQVVQTNRPGFVWNAKIMLFPGLPVRVVDAYVAGNGTLRPSILGLYPLADMHGSGEIARGELMRWFSEIKWYPTALLPSQGVVWQSVDDHSATATVTDGPLTLTLLFRFGADGLDCQRPCRCTGADERGGRGHDPMGLHDFGLPQPRRDVGAIRGDRRLYRSVGPARLLSRNTGVSRLYFCRVIRLIHHRPTPMRSGLPPGHWSARHYFGRVPVLSLPFYALGATGAALPFAPALPVSALMASVPIIAALSLVWHQNGAAAAGSLLNSAFNLRTIPGAGWIVFAMCVLPVAFALTGGLVWLSGTVLPNLIVLPASTIIPAFALFFLGAAGEELGWQGYAYPTLWQTHSVPGAALILGVVWAVWHVIPLRMMGRGADWILWHSAAMVLMRIVIVWLVVNTGRSILIAAVFHMMSNSVWGTFHDFSRWYDPMFMSAILAVAVAVILSVRGLGPLLPKDRRMP